MPQDIPLTLKLQNGATTYFIATPLESTIKDVAQKLTTVVNGSGGFLKNSKPVPVSEQDDEDIDIPKPDYGDSSDSELEGNTTTQTEPLNGDEPKGIQIKHEDLKFAVLTDSKKTLVSSLEPIKDHASTLKSLKIGDYTPILFALNEDEFDFIEPVMESEE